MTVVRSRLLLAALVFLITLQAAAEPVTLSALTSSQPLGPHLMYLEDPTGELDWSAVTSSRLASRWQRSQAETLSFGYTESTYWVRFRVTADAPGTWLLVLDYPVLDEVEVFIESAGQPLRRLTLGDRQPYGQRPLDHPTYIVPLELGPAEVTRIHLRAETSSSMQLPLTLWRKTAFIESTYEESVGRGAYYGAMLVMALYNLLVFVAIRDRSYLYYVMYVLSMVGVLGGIHGVTFKFAWPQTPAWHDLSIIISLCVMVVFTCLFTGRFLKMQHARPLLYRLLALSAALAALCGLASLVLPYRVVMTTVLVLTVFTISINFISGICRWLDGFEPARYYSIAWSLMLGGTLILALNKMGLIPRTWFTENAGLLGTAAEVVLLSFALANRVNLERKLREEAQQETAAAHKKLLDIQIGVNEKLDRTVRQRTEALEAANAQLQEMSTTDGLTQLRNRRYFNDVLVQEYGRSARERVPLAILMLDIDHFKVLNDQYGHPAGDACLVKAAELILDNIRRPPDTAARFGGEEFVILLPNTDRAGALCVAEAIRLAFERACLEWEGAVLAMTVSIGVTARIPTRDDHESLLRSADEALYRAKKSGRNTVC